MTSVEPIGVLVSTIGDNIERVSRRLLPQLQDTKVLVSHQVATRSDATPDEALTADNVTYIQVESVGLARNRNNCLAHMSQEINVLADDDVEYIPGFAESVAQAYEKYPQADGITFRVERDVHEQGKAKGDFKHTRLTIRSVASCGITFRASSIRRENVTFDERFGLGATYKSGEENVFLKDCIDAGLHIMHADTAIVQHTHVSSGWTWDTIQVCAKVAIAWRMYGPLVAFGAPLQFVVTKYSLYREHMNPLRFLWTSYRQWFRILFYGL